MAFPFRSRWLAVLVLLLLAGCGGGMPPPPHAAGGVLDLGQWDFPKDGVAPLDGQWAFSWGRFDDPEALAAQPTARAPVPGSWNELQAAGAYGFASYRLTVLCGQASGLALNLPVQHSAVHWYANGQLVARQGDPGTSAGTAAPAPVQQIVHLDGQACPLNIVAHVSNFDMRRGGLVRSLTLGTRQQVREERERAVVRDVFAMGGLVFMGGLPLLFFLTRRKDPSPLHFGLFCLTLALGLGLTGTRALQPLAAPLGWDGYMKIVFFCWYGSITFFALFVHSLYPQEFNRRVVQAVAAWGAASVTVVLLTPASVFTWLAYTLQLGSALAALYMALVMVRAFRAGRRSAGVLLAGVAVLTVTVVHDTLQFEHLQRLALVPYGLFVFVVAPAILLARRFSRALSSEELHSIEHRERADLIVRATKAGVLDWDAIKDRTGYSDRYREMLGYPVGPDAPDPPPFRQLLHPEDHDKVHGSFMKQLRDRSVTSGVRVNEPMDYRMKRADGDYLWIHAEGISVCDADGRTLRFIGSFIDITETKRHETAMSNRIKFINDLFDSVPLALALRDTEGRHLYVNRNWEQSVGITRDKVIGRSLLDLNDPAAAATLALDREALALRPGEVSPQREYDFRGRRFMQTRTVMVDSEGHRIGVLVASLDITEKYATEQALDVERERLRLLVRSTKAGFGDWDAVRDTITYSGRFKEMLGYPQDTDTSAWPSIFELMHPEDQEKARGQFRAMIRRRAPGAEEAPGEPMSYRLRRADGSWVWIHAEGISQADEAGRTRRFITSYLDVTAFHEQEEALRAQMALTRTEQRRLDLVVRGARVGIVDWDGRTHETYYSPRFREIRGYAPDADTTDWPDYFKVMIHPDDRKRVTGRWVPFIMGKGPEGPLGEYYAPEDYRLLRADGSYAWVQVSGIAVRDEKGFVLRWIAAIIDITGRRAQDEALRASHDQIAAQAAQLESQNEALKENVRLREEVERIGRHDIKTPLNSIVAVPRLLREERKLGPEADELLGIVERAGYRILSMVNLSLDLYKMEQGNYVFRPDAVDLTDLANKVIADVRMHAASKQVLLKLDIGEVPYAWAEELLCYSLLANLLKNAVEASPDGEVVTIGAGAGADGTVRLHIHNHGVVPESVRLNFFQKYATQGKASGTGLGTYSARLMAGVQDGDIAMETSEGGGTTLTVTLRAAPLGAVPATMRHAAERRGAEPQVVSSLPPTRVLLVDDDEYNLLIVRRFLPTPPFTVDTAINGKVALAAAELQWPDVIFMDLDMPVMGGLQAVQELRSLERATLARRCTIVALSSHEDDETRNRALAAGFDRYLTKPVTRDAIHETLLELNVLIGAEPVVPPPKAQPPAAQAGSNDPVLADADVEPVLADFVASRRGLIADMGAAMRDGQRGEVRRIAHQLAGSFGLYGFHWAGDQSRWIEKNFSDVDEAQLVAMMDDLLLHLDTVEVRFVQSSVQGSS
ncbi:MAG: PAS domain-containing protein [Burkholderiales bacterium]|nr:PAS domain-containing protein [Burkholderiales bacterium]